MIIMKSWQRSLLKLLNQESAPKVFFGTGTKEGVTTAIVAAKAKFVTQIYTVELSEALYRKASGKEFKNKDKVTFIHGDSRDVTPKYTRSIREPVFWYLDAHYCITKDREAAPNSFPLWGELEAVRDRGIAGDMVWIDDTHTFGKARPDLQQPWEDVTDKSILKFMGRSVRKSEMIGKGFVLWL